VSAVGLVTHDPVDAPVASSFGEPEQPRGRLRSVPRKVAETCVWKVTVREEQHHFLASLLMVASAACTASPSVGKIYEVSKLVSCSSMVAPWRTFEILGLSYTDQRTRQNPMSVIAPFETLRICSSVPLAERPQCVRLDHFMSRIL